MRNRLGEEQIAASGELWLGLDGDALRSTQGCAACIDLTLGEGTLLTESLWFDLDVHDPLNVINNHFLVLINPP